MPGLQTAACISADVAGAARLSGGGVGAILSGAVVADASYRRARLPPGVCISAHALAPPTAQQAIA